MDQARRLRGHLDRNLYHRASITPDGRVVFEPKTNAHPGIIRAAAAELAGDEDLQARIRALEAPLRALLEEEARAAEPKPWETLASRIRALEPASARHVALELSRLADVPGEPGHRRTRFFESVLRESALGHGLGLDELADQLLASFGRRDVKQPGRHFTGSVGKRVKGLRRRQREGGVTACA